MLDLWLSIFITSKNGFLVVTSFCFEHFFYQSSHGAEMIECLFLFVVADI
jgi:nicotinamide riboside transporter PnuC